jgi:hypothetical protein
VRYAEIGTNSGTKFVTRSALSAAVFETVSNLQVCRFFVAVRQFVRQLHGGHGESIADFPSASRHTRDVSQTTSSSGRTSPSAITGDTLIHRGKGLEFPRDWGPDDMDADEIFESLQPLRELSVELVLTTHGGPSDRAALERALS